MISWKYEAKITANYCPSLMHLYKWICCCFLGFGLDGTQQMDPREVFKLWVHDLLPELQIFFSIALTQNSRCIHQLFPCNVCFLTDAIMV